MIKRLPMLAFVVLVSGYVLWSVTFIAFYAGHHLTCEAVGTAQVLGIAAPLLVVGVLWVGMTALQAGLLWWVGRLLPSEEGAAGFVRRVTLGLAAAALAAAILLGLPVLFSPPCV